MSEEHSPGVVVMGAGGQAKVTIEILRAMGKQPAYCIAHEGEECLGVAVLKEESSIEDLRRQGYTQAIVALGSNIDRARVAMQLEEAGYELINAISPQSLVSPTARLGKGVVVLPGAIINADAVISDLAIINTGAVVEHDCHVGYCAHLAPQTGLGGNVTIHPFVFLGLGAKVIPGVTIGSHTVVGAGAVVVSDLPENVRAVGVPARVLKDRAAND